jgi:hypothetical protein
MIYQPYPQYTSKWINVELSHPIDYHHYEWLHNHEGGMFHTHNSKYRIKFELEKDAVLFILRWA